MRDFRYTFLCNRCADRKIFINEKYNYNAEPLTDAIALNLEQIHFMIYTDDVMLLQSLLIVRLEARKFRDAKDRLLRR